MSRLIRDKQAATMKAFFTNTPMTEADMHYRRGFGAGLDYVLDMVENGERRFAEIAAKRKEAEQVG